MTRAVVVRVAVMTLATFFFLLAATMSLRNASNADDLKDDVSDLESRLGDAEEKLDRMGG
jgi:hypothetical protein